MHHGVIGHPYPTSNRAVITPPDLQFVLRPGACIKNPAVEGLPAIRATERVILISPSLFLHHSVLLFSSPLYASAVLREHIALLFDTENVKRSCPVEPVQQFLFFISCCFLLCVRASALLPCEPACRAPRVSTVLPLQLWFINPPE